MQPRPRRRLSGRESVRMQASSHPPGLQPARNPELPCAPSTARRWHLNKLFLFIVCIESVFTLVAIVCRRIPNHDSFQYFHLQYYFLNHAVMHGEIPQWMPFMTHGTVANWWYAVQGGLFQNALLLLSLFTSVLKSVGFLTLFHLGMWADQILLLTGTWLLARRFYQSQWTCFYVCVCAAGSSIWMDQIWWNFHFYFAIPLILHFLYCFIEEGKWWQMFAALDLFAVQTLGNLPYCVAFTSLLLFLFMAMYAAANYRAHLEHLRSRRFHAGFLCALAAGAAMIAGAYSILRLGTGDIVSYNSGRGPDGHVPLDGFMTYGSNTSVWRWLETAFGISPGLDNTLYFGFLGLPLLVAACFHIHRKHVHIYAAAVLSILFGMSTIVSMAAYYLWPYMKYFRHIGLTAGVSRLLLIFVAGFGFEMLFASPQNAGRYMKFGAASGMVLIGVSAVTLFYSAFNPATGRLLLSLSDKPTYVVLLSSDAFIHRFVCAGVFAAAAGVLLLCRSLTRIAPRVLLIVCAALTTLDLYAYKGMEMAMRTEEMHESLLAFQPMPYAKRRAASFPEGGARAKLLSEEPGFHGAKYWTLGSFAFADEAGCSFRVDHWLRPFDNYIRTVWGQKLADPLAPPGQTEQPHARLDNALAFPFQNEAAAKISGLTEDKIQFFKGAYRPSTSDRQISAQMRSPLYRGGTLLLSEGNVANIDGAPDPAENDRIHLKYTVERFDANNLWVTTENPATEPAWMMYSDVWDPNWSATVNGKEVAVAKANLAYKAVALQPGTNKVHFNFAVPGISVLYWCFCANSTAWLGVLAALSVGVVFERARCIEASHFQAPVS